MGTSNAVSSETKAWFIIPFFNKRNQGSLEKWLILGPGHLATPKSKEVLLKKKKEGIAKVYRRKPEASSG